MRIIIISCFFLLISIGVCGQYQLRGRVLSSDKAPLGYAAVSIYPLQDTTDIKGTITDETGTFLFYKLSPTTYQLTVQMLGYKDWSQQFILTEDTNLGAIALSEDVEQLKVIEVVAEQSSIESHLGKKVLRIGKDLSSTGSNVLEALEIIPSVTTTPRGQVLIRGSSSVLIYINGKETKRDPASLKFIAAESIEKIEIITNPSAEHDAEGIGGIINIVYRKNKNNSFKLELVSNLSVLTDPLYLNPGGGVNFSWTKKKFSLFTNLSHNYSKYENYADSKRISFSDSLQRYENLTSRKGMGNFSNALVGFSIEPDSTSSIGLEANFLRWDLANEIHQQNLFDYRASEPESIYILNEGGEVEDELWVNLSYEKAFKKQQSIKVSLTAGGEDETNVTKSEEIDLTTPPFDTQQFLRVSDEWERQRYYHGKVDFELPIKKWGILQTGVKADFIRYYIFQKIDLQSETIDLPDNDYEMNMQKLGGYLIQKKKFSFLEYAVGVRFEQFKSEGFQTSNQKSFTQAYTVFFPSLQLNYPISGYDHTIGVNYTRRINRPGFFDLNPYVSYEDPLNLKTGNPELEPEIADLIELNYHKEWSRFNIDFTLYNRKIANSIQAIIEPIDNNRTLASYVNIDSQTRRGIELQLEYRLKSSFKTWGTFVLAQSQYEDSENEIRFNNQPIWSVRLKQELNLKNNWKIELSEIYKAPSYQIQQKTHGNYYMDVGINKKFARRRVSISLAVRDLFNTRQFVRSMHTASFEVERSYKWQTRRVILAMKYIIFNAKN